MHRQAYVEQKNRVNTLIDETKTSHYSATIKDKAGNPKELFQIIDSLIHGRNSSPKLPTHTSTSELANRFADYFAEKIDAIRKISYPRQEPSTAQRHQHNAAMSHLPCFSRQQLTK